MIVNISYPLVQLHETARFIWENNPSVRNWPSKPESIFDVMHGIRDMMRRDAMRNAQIIKKEQKLKVNLDAEWVTYTGTGGYYFLYELRSDDTEEDITICATILVDLSVGHTESGYVTEFVDEIAD
jgi:hypothetical protein